MSVEECQPETVDAFENCQSKGKTMRTLEEVIKVMDHVEFCCTNCKLQFDCDEVECFLKDALHYLQEYRERKENYEDASERHHAAYRILEARMKWKAAKLFEDDNPPLTWDELKVMTEKPVWVEDNIETPEDITKYWAIMWRIEKAEGDEYALLSDFYYEKSQYGKDWKAYRKERE